METRDFFISYTKADEAWAVWIAQTLKEVGYSVFIQAWDCLPGENFITWMGNAIEHSNSFIAVWSQRYAKSKYCLEEISSAYKRKIEGRIKLFLVVRIEETFVMAPYDTYVRVNLFSGENKRNQLLQAIQRNEYKRSHAPNSMNKTSHENDSGNVSANTSSIAYQHKTQSHDVNIQQRPAANKATSGTRAAVNATNTQLKSTSIQQHNDNIQQETSGWISILGVLLVAWIIFFGIPSMSYSIETSRLYNLGVQYYEGNGVEQDFGVAFDYFMQAGERGNSNALYHVGYFYHWGYGVEQNYIGSTEKAEKVAGNGKSGKARAPACRRRSWQ